MAIMPVQLTLRSSDYAQIFGAKATKAMGLTATYGSSSYYAQ